MMVVAASRLKRNKRQPRGRQLLDAHNRAQRESWQRQLEAGEGLFKLKGTGGGGLNQPKR
jgi:hypothetical protein